MVRSKFHTSHHFLFKNLQKNAIFVTKSFFENSKKTAIIRCLWNFVQIVVYGENKNSQYIISHRTCKVNVQNY